MQYPLVFKPKRAEADADFATLDGMFTRWMPIPMTVHYRALLSDRFAALSRRLLSESPETYFRAMSVGSLLYDAVCCEDDILIGMRLAAGCRLGSLSETERMRLTRLARARHDESSLSTADAGILVALSVIELRDAIVAFERAGTGALAGEGNDRMREIADVLNAAGRLYLRVRHHPLADALYPLLQRAMEITQIEPNVFVDERPVYVVTSVDKDLPPDARFVRLIERLYLSHALTDRGLFITAVGFKECRALPAWMVLLQAHRPDVKIVRSDTRHTDQVWERRRCVSWTQAMRRARIRNLMDRAAFHELGCPIDVYDRLVREVGVG